MLRLSVLYFGSALPSRSLLDLTSVRGWLNRKAILRLAELGKLKKSSDLIGIKTRDLTAWSLVPQPTTLLRAPILEIIHRRVSYLIHNISETIFSLRLQAKPTRQGPIDRASRSPVLSRLYLPTETNASLRNYVWTYSNIISESLKTEQQEWININGMSLTLYGEYLLCLSSLIV
jgi:hypothetical protein